ncbi:hypothetical protein TWF694_011761 [Orbilia ellipsospora]|uniref:Uncharacterized protein n=1 Tax=Orbilia ellipsospora TaxID=2528407 RepID=A0AAV9X664_9PEZI
MKFLNIAVATAAAFSGLSEAIITGISIPSTIKAGDGFNLYINTANYIQSVYDVSVALGVAPGKGIQGALGQVTDSFYLGPSQSNVLYRIPKWTTIPSSLTKGTWTYAATFFSLYGAGAAPTLVTYNVTITVGDTTSTSYVTSKP